MYVFNSLRRDNKNRLRLYTALDFAASEVETQRDTGKTIGSFRVVEGTGKASTGSIRVRSEGACKSGFGNKQSFSIHARRTAAGIKDVIRRVRPEEEAVINDIDEKIERLEAEIINLKVDRRAAVAEAWSKAHVVRLAEVEAVATKVRVS